MYDTLEEFALCGYTYFPVREISDRLRAKGKKGRRSKKRRGGANSSRGGGGGEGDGAESHRNEYEKEYLVRTIQK